jgi:cytochrome c2
VLRRLRAVVPVATTVLAVATTVACDARDESSAVPGADPARGPELVATYGCGSCHQIPGVAGADGRVAPSLEHFSQRGVIAGALPFTADNLVDWIMHPQSIEPGVAMPEMGVTEQDARDLAAYLLGLD